MGQCVSIAALRPPNKAGFLPKAHGNTVLLHGGDQGDGDGAGDARSFGTAIAINSPARTPIDFSGNPREGGLINRSISKFTFTRRI